MPIATQTNRVTRVETCSCGFAITPSNRALHEAHTPAPEPHCFYGTKGCTNTSDAEHTCNATPLGYARAAMADIGTINPKLSSREAKAREVVSMIHIAAIQGLPIDLTADQVGILSDHICRVEARR